MSAEIPGYMRVRAYLYNLAEHGTGEMQKIPSENELCRMFGLSRMTVREAIRGLVESRFLVTRRGVGTFVNSSIAKQSVIHFPLIGILHAGGRNVYQTASPAVRTAVLESGMIPEMILLPDSNDPLRLLEMAANHLAAVIWDSPGPEERPYLFALREKGVPLLLVGDRENLTGIGESFDLLATSRAERGRRLGALFLEYGHERICYIHNYTDAFPEKDSPENPETTSGALCAELRKYNPDAVMQYRSIGELDAVLDSFRPTVLYSENILAPYISRCLKEKGLEVPEGLSYLSYKPSASYFFNRKTVACIDEAPLLHEEVIAWLDQRILRGDLDGVFQRKVEPLILPNQTLRNRKDGK